MSKTTANTLHHCVFNLNVHLVLVTKYRRRCMTDAMLERLREICVDLAAKCGCTVVEFNGEADHVHLLLALTPRIAPSAFVNNLKTVTSRLLRKEFAQHLAAVYRNPAFWSRSYCALSVGGVPLSVLKQYIEQQERPD